VASLWETAASPASTSSWHRFFASDPARAISLSGSSNPDSRVQRVIPNDLRRQWRKCRRAEVAFPAVSRFQRQAFGGRLAHCLYLGTCRREHRAYERPGAETCER